MENLRELLPDDLEDTQRNQQQTLKAELSNMQQAIQEMQGQMAAALDVHTGAGWPRGTGKAAAPAARWRTPAPRGFHEATSTEKDAAPAACREAEQVIERHLRAFCWPRGAMNARIWKFARGDGNN